MSHLANNGDHFVDIVVHSLKNGRHIYGCPKGLWEVSSPDRKVAEREARHYFIQYYNDGEYSSHVARTTCTTRPLRYAG